MEFAPFTLAENPRQITEDRAHRIGERVRQHGLSVVGLHWLLAAPDGMHWTSPDRVTRDKTTEFLIHLVNVCSALGGEVMVWGSPKQRSFDPTEEVSTILQRAADVLVRVCEAAGDAGVTIAIEPLGPRETNFLNTAAETIELIERVDHSACKLHLDVKAMASERFAIEEIIQKSKNHTAHFHANDPNLKGPGQGAVDFTSVAQALQSTGYDRWVSVEVFDYSPDAPTIARESMKALRKGFASSLEENRS